MKKAIEKEEVKPIESEEKPKLEEAFVLWKQTTNTGKSILKGHDLHGNKIVGFFKTNKTNPKQPDINICEVNVGSDGKEEAGNQICSLWEYVSSKGSQYLLGSTDEKENIIAFYNISGNEKQPYIRGYFQENK